MIFKVWKKARELVKEEMKLHKAIKRVQRASLDYEALQVIVDNVANAPSAIEIKIHTEDGMDITIQQTTRQDVPYTSFSERYKSQHGL